MQKYKRALEKPIISRFFKAKVIVLYGARQVGKTTLAKEILKRFGNRGIYLNCELPSVQTGLSSKEPPILKAFFGNRSLVVLDEAQSIPEIGLKLKIIVDTLPRVQILATGSSSFNLAEKTSEPLTGRSHTFLLYPISISELVRQNDVFSVHSRIENLLRFGMYPEILNLSEQEAKNRLDEIASQYLYKDILQFGDLRKPSLIKDLVTLLALQVGQEVSYNELATQLGISRLTVENYIDVLEKAFVVFRLRAFSRNQRKEIRKSVKIYFLDLGIRNSVIQNFSTLDKRSDSGALWENFCLVERMKRDGENDRRVNRYFWRTYQQKEVDYVEESDGKISGFEFKFTDSRKTKIPHEFIRRYGASFQQIDRNNYPKFVLPK